MRVKPVIIGIKRIHQFLGNSVFMPHQTVLFAPYAQLSNLAKDYMVKHDIKTMKSFWQPRLRLKNRSLKK